MSYLHTPRLVFSGSFQADVSTVNNDVRHYDNSTFEPRFQELPDGNVRNGWWNPSGGAIFQLAGCAVKQVTDADGTVSRSAADDPVIGQLVAGPGDRTAGKLVDIDPQMQMTSEIWGLSLRLFAPSGELVLEGLLAPVGFRDLQLRQVANQGQNGQPVGATWTSVLTELTWGELASRSKVLQELRTHSQDGLLAIQLTAFGYYYAHNDGRFSMGRLLGTIGPYVSGEPRFFAPARRLIGAVFKHQAPSDPESRFDRSNFLWDRTARRLSLDLGASFPITDPQGTVENIGRVRIAVAKIPDVPIRPNDPTRISSDQSQIIGEVDYFEPEWLANTAGIVSLSVSGAAVDLLQDHQLLLLGDGTGGQDQVLACETTRGLAVRADQNVPRLDPGEAASVDLYAFQWGRPLTGAEISLSLSRPSQSGGGPPNDPNPPTAPIPFTNIPASALTFPEQITTDENGRASLRIEAGDPGNPRRYVDGQIYQIVYQLDGLPRTQQYFLDQVIVHVRDAYTVPDQPSWDDVREILAQFGNLYPLMSKHIVDLRNRDDVLNHRDILLFAFTRDERDSLYMPVTRDLSATKRETIVRWLQMSAEPEEAAIPAATATEAAAAARGMLVPTAEDKKRPAGSVMRRAQFEQMTQGEGGKIDAFKGGSDAVELVDED